MLKLRSCIMFYLIVFALTGACCYAQTVFSGNI